MAIAPMNSRVNVWLVPVKRVMSLTMVDVQPIPHFVSNHRVAFYARRVEIIRTVMAMPASV